MEFETTVRVGNGVLAVAGIAMIGALIWAHHKGHQIENEIAAGTAAIEAYKANEKKLEHQLDQ